jgi:hypothetical protein
MKHFTSLCLFILFTISINNVVFGQCAGGLTVSTNTNCKYLVWDTPPIPLPNTISESTPNPGTYTLIGGTGVAGDPAIYSDGACPNSTPGGFSGELTIGTATCSYNNGTLPIVDRKINHKIIDNKVEFTWEAFDLDRTSSFEIHRRIGWESEEPITSVETNHRTSGEFSAQVPLLNGNQYYIFYERNYDGGLHRVAEVTVGNVTEVRISPNPVQSYLSFSGNTVHDVILYDIMGRVVYTSPKEKQVEKVDIQNLSQGTYMVSFTKDDHKYKQQIFKQN